MRGLKIFGGVAALWLAALLVIGAVYGGRAKTNVAQRIGDSLQAQVTIEDATLGLVRGFLAFHALAVRKEDLGHLAIDVDAIRCELPPLGWALVDGECRQLTIEGLRMDVSAAAVFRLQRPKRAPLHVRSVAIRDAVLVFAPSAFLPDLGRIAIRIARAEAGPTTFTTPLSFLFGLTALDATIELPAGITVKLGYANGLLTASGGIFGKVPVALAIALPIADAAGDAQAEIRQLVAFGRDLAERLVAKRAEDWLKHRIRW